MWSGQSEGGPAGILWVQAQRLTLPLVPQPHTSPALAKKGTLFIYFFLLRQGFALYFRLALNSRQSPSLCLLGAGIMSVRQNTWLGTASLRSETNECYTPCLCPLANLVAGEDIIRDSSKYSPMEWSGVGDSGHDCDAGHPRVSSEQACKEQGCLPWHLQQGDCHLHPGFGPVFSWLSSSCPCPSLPCCFLIHGVHEPCSAKTPS